MITRELYVNKILEFANVPIIKVITGIRRCGKSTILSQIKDELIKKSNKDAVLYINFEGRNHYEIRTGHQFDKLLSQSITKSTKYILLDEIQNVDNFETVINAYNSEGIYDIYLTGSNSKLLSKELSTVLGGRTTSFHINTLSFSEFIDIKQNCTEFCKKNIDEKFEEYLKIGGFPLIGYLNMNEEQASKSISDIFASVILKDTVERNKIKNQDLIQRLAVFLAENIGSTFSAKSISNFLSQERKDVNVETILKYLSFLENSFYVSKVKRYDIKGKENLKIFEKYYIADHSFTNALIGFNENNIASYLENIVYNELIKRGYKVMIGKFNDKEIDFVATKLNKPTYIQVSQYITNDEVYEREFGNLNKLNTSRPKIVLTLDKNQVGDHDDIECLYLPDWLLKE
jgi:predicted AAA+ superfamily ATPase